MNASLWTAPQNPALTASHAWPTSPPSKQRTTSPPSRSSKPPRHSLTLRKSAPRKPSSPTTMLHTPGPSSPTTATQGTRTSPILWISQARVPSACTPTKRPSRRTHTRRRGRSGPDAAAPYLQLVVGEAGPAGLEQACVARVDAEPGRRRSVVELQDAGSGDGAGDGEYR
ncbi:uncharacterized protein K441DRAFT_676038 [Cenococcum geophilum 1.58]|uniref:uncharacterized protein n=1 Tax=Cenococcum geophilum 1.58 TaxID=794803 RepID=UPI00358FAB06|nr:hypothetical protein K441DRAFT_676038 [Cenococcum geophilum 1.58]